jgi:hypothetical protein
MMAIARRLQRIETRLGLVAETREEKVQAARLEAARLRCGLPPPSPERLAELRGMKVVDILNAARHQAALANQRQLPGKTAPEFSSAVPHLRPGPRPCRNAP